MRYLIALGLAFAAVPASAATGPFFSLGNTNFVVLIAFVVFLALLVYMKVPSRVAGMLDDRAKGIRSDLDEARSIREEAQSVLSSFDRRQKEVASQSERIVTNARAEAEAAAAQAKEDLAASIARRVKAAEDQIASAEAAAMREVRDRAVTIAVAAARDVLARQMTDDRGDALIDAAIGDVEQKLH